MKQKVGCRKSISFAFNLLSLLLVAGCAQRQPVLATSTKIISTARVEPTQTPLPVPTIKPEPNSTVSPVPTITPTPTITSTPTLEMNAPAGIAYCNQDLWLVQPNGKTIKLGPCDAQISPNQRFSLYVPWPLSDDSHQSDLRIVDLYTGKTTDMPQFTVTNLQDAVWDPDSRHIYYTAGQDYANKDIWVVDMQTGQTKNLTHSPAIDDANIGFWPYPGLVLFTSRSINENGGPDLAGHLADMKPNGEQPRILSHDFIVEPPVASPDGRTLAILFGQLLQWGGSIQDITFHLINSDYQPKNVVLADPAWSPDGKQIAWSVYVATEDTEYNVLDGVGIYNLANHELRLFNLYVDPGGEGFQRAPVWSPDGQWLALEDNDPSLKNTGLWVARFDGSEEHYLGNFDNPVWSPDSQWLACNDIQVLDMSIGTWVSKVGNWLPYQINLTDNVELVDWNDAAVSSKWKGLPVFTLGNFYVVTDAGNNVTVYDQPAFDSKTVGQLSSDETIKIIAGPIENGEDTWWEMEDDQAGIKGWIIEYWDRYISAN